MKTIINRDFTRLWYGQAVSKVGDYVFNTTLILWIATKLGNGKSWAPMAVSGVLLSGLVAAFAIAPAAGVFADRWNRKRTMLWMDAVRAVLVGGLAAVAFIPADKLPVGAWLTLIYVVVFGVNAAGTFFGPSRMAVVPDVVDGPDQIAKAAGITQSTEALAGMIGPPLAAPLLFAAGVQWAVIINALSYVVSFLAIRSVPIPDNSTSAAERSQSGFWADFKIGITFFAKTRVLVVLIVASCIANFGAQAMNTLDVFFVTRNLHAAPKLYGLLGMAFGAGAIIGALFSVRVVRRIGLVNAIWLPVVVAGLLIMGYARQTSIWAAIPLIFVYALPIAVVNATLEPLVIQVTPRKMLGRVISVFMPVISITQLGSTMLIGWLFSTVMLHFHANAGGLHMGPIDTIFTITGLLFLAAAAYAFILLPRKGIAAAEPDRESDHEPDREPDTEPDRAPEDEPETART
ncbi:MFS transporter [Catenulispora pinisilvae]|uniref:MFS transporter n=1 Tax=Catenulispora pinisilvae TaxID=2705253 RepID=UPI001891043C|nr:MFS transporter [Catenulispora pinisilvae]